jgi:uncharacterized protein with HEPN domain
LPAYIGEQLIAGGKMRTIKTMGRDELLMDIVEYGDTILNRVEGQSVESLIADDVLFDAILHRLRVVADVTKRLITIDPEIKSANPEVPWNLMSGLGNEIVHGYNAIDPAAMLGLILRDGFEELIKLARR